METEELNLSVTNVNINVTDSLNESVNAISGIQKDPGNTTTFRGGLIKQVLKECVEDFMGQRQNQKFDKSVKEMKNRTMAFSEFIRDKIVEMGFPRTKFVVQVFLGEANKVPGFTTGVRFFWDAKTDDFSSYHMEMENVFCLVVAFGVRAT